MTCLLSMDVFVMRFYMVCLSPVVALERLVIASIVSFSILVSSSDVAMALFSCYLSFI